jgi:hypothetical protein
MAVTVKSFKFNMMTAKARHYNTQLKALEERILIRNSTGKEY